MKDALLEKGKKVMERYKQPAGTTVYQKISFSERQAQVINRGKGDVQNRKLCRRAGPDPAATAAAHAQMKAVSQRSRPSHCCRQAECHLL